MRPTSERDFRERVQAFVMLGAGPSLTRGEADALLEWVRSGGRLLYAPLPREVGASQRDPFLATLGVERRSRSEFDEWTAQQPHAAGLSAQAARLLEGTPSSVSCSGALDLTELAGDIPCEVLLGPEKDRSALALLHPGAGTIVLLTSTAPLTNAGLAESELTVATLRALAALADGGTLWFDEFHHGHDERVSVTQAGRRFLLGTHTGWALLALAAVGLIAVVVRGIRLGPPLPEPPPASRSSLEHVEALAAAWGVAHAHARPALLLVEGLRLRLGLAHQQELGERLAAVARREPQLSGAVATIGRACEGGGPVSGAPSGLVPLADAIDAVLEAEGRRALPSGWDSRA